MAIPLHACRSLTKDIGISDPKITAPALLIMGEKDYVLKFPGMEEYLKNGAILMKQIIPNLDVTYVEEGCHFVHEQFPEHVNHLIISFLDKHSV